MHGFIAIIAVLLQLSQFYCNYCIFIASKYGMFKQELFQGMYLVKQIPYFFK